MKEWGHFRRLSATVLGVPIELLRRVVGSHNHLDKDIVFTHPGGWSITANRGMPNDRFTLAPNLRRRDGRHSDGAPIHDKGWYGGEKDDGSVLTFDENNEALGMILLREGHLRAIRYSYGWGVSLPRMRRKWKEKHGHT